MQVVTPEFNRLSQNEIVPLDWGLRVSFDKEFNPDITFAQYDISMYDDPEYVYSPSVDNPIQFWDYYDYKDYSSRILSMEWTREIQFPYSVVSAMADFSLNNFDDYFTPDSGSPIDEYILPKRPVRLLAGYATVSNTQQFVGITETTPVRDEISKTVSFHALDFLSEIFDTDLSNVIAMQNVTTDVVLEAIFTQFGLSPSSYVLAKGRNMIRFVFFDKDKNAGEAIRELMQAEGGNLWIDEQGIIRFETRLMPDDSPVMVFNDSNVIDITSTGDAEIINFVRIISDVREVQEYQPVFTNAREPGQQWSPAGDPFIIAANSSRPYPADLQDPCLTAVEPDFGEASNISWFTAIRSDGTPVVSNVSVTGSELNNNQFITFIQNNNSFPIEIDQMEIWGEPAKVINQIRYEAKDQDSIDIYEEQKLEITNNFFGSYNNCDSFSETIIDAYKDHSPVIEMSVKGNYALQLGDIIQIDARSYNEMYKITKITNVVYPYRCTIRARRYVPKSWARYDISLYDNGDVYAP